MSEIVDKKRVDDDEESDEEEEVPPLEEKKAEDEPELTLEDSDVVTKYQEAAKIANAVLLDCLARCIVGANVGDICKFGDDLINEKTSLIYRGKSKSGKPIEKGVAFPVCVSVNEVVCNCSPLPSEQNKFAPLAVNDLVKIDLAVHIDGYIAAVAHTVIVGTSENITGPKADLVRAAYDAAEVASKMIKPGNSNKDVTVAMKKVADAYGVKCIAGVEMYQMKRYVIDGNKKVLLRDEPELKVDACTFEQYEAYAIDVEMSTGEGKVGEKDARTTVFKRIVGNKHNLKVKAARMFFNEVNNRFPTLPFTLRCFNDEKVARMGVTECRNNLLQSYPVFCEKQNELVAQFKFTILLMKNGTAKITGLPCPPQFVSDKVLPDDIKEILNSELMKKKTRGGKKK